MLRTDRGDNEGSNEWGVGREDEVGDRIGDDDFDVVIRAGGHLEVAHICP